MKLTITEGYKPQTYEVIYDFEMNEQEADSFNASVQTYFWNVYEIDFNKRDHIAVGETLELALQKAADFLKDRAFMQRLKEEEAERVANAAALEARKLEKKILKQQKKEQNEKIQS